MTFSPIKNYRSQILEVLIVIVIVFIASLLNFRVTESPNPAIAWITAITLAACINKLHVLPGIIIGSVATTFLPVSQYPMTHTNAGKLLIDSITGLFMCLSALVMIRFTKISHSKYWLLIAFSLIILLWLSLQQPDIRISMIYFAAAAITACLSGVKNRSTGAYPSAFFVSLFIGYLPWILFMRFLTLDLKSIQHPTIFLRNYLLVPFPLLILLTLIASHIVYSLNEDSDNPFSS
jgi:hypothetical protein